MKATPYINMHAVYDALYGLPQDTVMRIDLSVAPHTQEGQRPGFDWPPDDVIDEYQRSLRAMAQFQLGLTVETTPRDEPEGRGIFAFDVFVTATCRKGTTEIPSSAEEH